MAAIFIAGFLLLVSAGPAKELATATDFAPIMLGLALLVVGAKLAGLVAEELGQPSVLGELFFGIILANLSPLIGGDSGIEFVRSNETLAFLGRGWRADPPVRCRIGT